MEKTANWFKNIFNKFKKFKSLDWVEFSLWVLTGISLLLVIIFSASLKSYFGDSASGVKNYYDSVAAVSMVFAIFLIASIFFTVFRKYRQKKLKEQKTTRGK
jgi:membrane protease YdiL (CAAX protease family)